MSIILTISIPSPKHRNGLHRELRKVKPQMIGNKKKAQSKRFCRSPEKGTIM